MSLAIIFLHRGNSGYLKYSLSQARYYNPDSDIFLLGDEENNKYPFIQHELIADYDSDAKKFASKYRHFSTNSFEVELFCFQRWFVIRKFLNAKNIERFLYLDSDVLLYGEADILFRSYNQYKFTVSNSRGPQCCYFPHKKTIDDLCQFIDSIYTDVSLKKYEEEFKERKEKGLHGGMCDMTAFYEFSQLFPGEVADLIKIREDSVFDDNFSISDGFEMENGKKKIYWNDSIPYGKHLETGHLIKFNSLHFQGSAKSEIDRYYTGKLFVWERLRRKFKRFRKGIR